ncbi:CDC48 family AAA ATPase [archaeon]|jgi:transitional endoplasmic reticulum ATPase|nr:CDC48 family AAA ATPase [archaeon]MBT7128751.1 CDC48 family AAA ATPase [archaeon]
MKEKQNNTTIKLRVVESLQDDVGKGIVRIDPSLMRKLNLERGDIILVEGNRTTHVIVDQAYPADHGEDIIRMDGITRKNCKAGIGEHIQAEKGKIIEAKKITIAPAQKGIMVKGNPDGFKRGLLGKPVNKGDIVVMGGAQQRKDIMSDDFNNLFGGDMSEVFNQMGFGGIPGGLTQVRFVIASTSPSKPCIVTENTQITLSPKAIEISEESIPQITYEDIGGLTEEVKKVREMVELPLKRPEIFMRLGIEPPKGVLLYGPPGTGKTLLAKAVANESEAHFILLNGPEIMSKFYGESEKKIRAIFEEAEKNAPAIIFIDEIDSLAPKREDTGGEVERRVVSQLLTMMDGLQDRGKVVVIGATNRPNAIDPALRRPGRFDREVEISVPDKTGRRQIIQIHTRNMPLTKSVDLDEISRKTHGFVGADINSLAKEAAMIVIRNNLDKLKLKEGTEIPQEVLDKLRISGKDFDEALKVVRPSAMREVLVETPSTRWKDIGGVDEVKRDLKEAVEWPLKFPDSFSRMGISPPKGVLLYGPPGTGKTLLAKAVANESEANFIQIKGPSLLSMWVGKSEEGVRKIFERARQVSPCIIFFDEIDSMAGRRGAGTGGGTKVAENVLNQLLAEMDGIEDLTNVIVIGATNRPDILDPALLRPGRFDRIVYVPVPCEEGRLEILKIHTDKMPIVNKNEIIEKLSKETEGFTGADIESLAREAAMLALRENIDSKKVSKEHFMKAMEKVRPSVSKNDEDRYKQIESKYLKSAKAALTNSSRSYTG